MIYTCQAFFVFFNNLEVTCWEKGLIGRKD